MAQRVFYDYISGSGTNEIDEWLSSFKTARPEVAAGLDFVIEMLESAKSLHARPHAAPIKDGKYRGLYELRFFACRTQMRPIVYEGPFRRATTILCGATKKNERFVKPKDPLKLAWRRIGLLNVKEASVERHV